MAMALFNQANRNALIERSWYLDCLGIWVESVARRKRKWFRRRNTDAMSLSEQERVGIGPCGLCWKVRWVAFHRLAHGSLRYPWSMSVAMGRKPELAGGSDAGADRARRATALPIIALTEQIEKTIGMDVVLAEGDGCAVP